MAKHTGETIIKKYANRRLYNTGTSTYVTLEDLAKMVKRGEEFKVQDAKTSEDITHAVLTQIPPALPVQPVAYLEIAHIIIGIAERQEVDRIGFIMDEIGRDQQPGDGDDPAPFALRKAIQNSQPAAKPGAHGR